MIAVNPTDLGYLDQCLHDLDSLQRLRTALDKLEKCCLAAQGQHNLADILSDPDNGKSILASFGTEGFDTAVQILTKLSLGVHTSRSVLTHTDIASPEKIAFLARCLGGWKQFDVVVTLQYPNAAWRPIRLINPSRGHHWKHLDAIPAGTLCTGFFRLLSGKKSQVQESLAADRFELALDTLQRRKEPLTAPVPSVQVSTKKASGKNAAKRGNPVTHLNPQTSGPPVTTLRVVVNKMDLLVHAGNANLICAQLRTYPGRVVFLVRRAEMVKVHLDADSIWSAEIRNGETVFFEFYGPMPEEEFMKELAKCVNRYTQMDKIANE